MPGALSVVVGVPRERDPGRAELSSSFLFISSASLGDVAKQRSRGQKHIYGLLIPSIGLMNIDHFTDGARPGILR
jgi:hypothetical protein